MPKYISNRQIQNMSYNQLAQAVTSGALTEKRIRSYYTDARRLALQRSARVQASEFGEITEKEYFRKLRNLPTTRDLLHEVADVNKYLTSDRSTITGQKKIRERYIETAERHGFNIDDSSYNDWVKFIQWFKASEFALSYDSDSEEVLEVFNEGSSINEWRELFTQFTERRRLQLE